MSAAVPILAFPRPSSENISTRWLRHKLLMQNFLESVQDYESFEIFKHYSKRNQTANRPIQAWNFQCEISKYHPPPNRDWNFT